MIFLPNGCKCSEMSVSPKNWQTSKASLDVTWYIHYRFYDANQADEARFANGKQVIIKAGLNRLKTLSERQIMVKALLEAEKELLEVEQYNPITGYKVPKNKGKTLGDLPIMEAFEFAFEKKDCTNHMKEDFRSILKYVSQAAEKTGLTTLPITKVERHHIKELLDCCGKVKKNWSPNTFNQYRAHLSILCKELVEYDALPYNPTIGIAKKKVILKNRKTLSIQERLEIAEVLKSKEPDFWRFLQIFFHSGCRETELVNLKVENIHLEEQRFSILVKKGRQYRETEKVIKDVALPFWEEQLKMAKPGYFVFGKGLRPNKNPIRPEQITRRWKRHIKDKLGIEADFYSLKHLNTDETAALLDLGDAAAHNSHTSTVITLKHYAFGEKARQQERIKKVGNSFAG
jgi:integrase